MTGFVPRKRFRTLKRSPHFDRVTGPFNLTWLHETLHLGTKEKCMELASMADGITAAFSLNSPEEGRTIVDPQVVEAAAIARR